MITSVVTLLPLLVGLLLWSRLPEKIPTHWNFSGEIDGYSGKAFGVLFIPLFCFACHWFIIGCMLLDPKSRNITGKAAAISLWFTPIFSVALSFFVYASALGMGIRVELFFALALGIMYIIIGNYLPKCQPNYTVGIRLSWTLDSEEVWRRTHRFAGKIWVVAGGILLLSALTPWAMWVFLGVVAVTALGPILYAAWTYKKIGK